MSVLQVPADETPWPTLGAEICDFIEDRLVFGPGDRRGEPAELDPETRALIYRAYEVFPRDHERAGRRRFKRVGLSLRKGVGKTELASWLSACELHPEAPVRCDGFRKVGKRWEPVGVGVRDPYIPLLAVTAEQSEDLAYYTLLVVLSEGPLADDFDIGLERIVRTTGDGKAVPLAGSPDARDGSRVTFQVFDETHRLTLPRLIEAHQTMLANAAKRKMADPWSLEVTTAYAPGEGSVAERTAAYAEKIAKGDQADPSLFYFHRQAGDGADITTEEGARAAVIEASGAAAEWSDIDAILDLWRAPDTDLAFWERVYCNRPVALSSQAFDAEAFAALAQPEMTIAPDRQVVLGFDGSRFNDDTGLVATDVASGFQTVIGHWHNPGYEDWEVPEDEVEAAVEDAFHRWNVARLYADPAWWESTVAKWEAAHGEKCVEPWWTHPPRRMSAAVAAYATAIKSGELSHDGDADLVAHVGNARRREVRAAGDGSYTIQKERPDSPHKIDLAMAAILSWEARRDALAKPAPAYRRATFSNDRPTLPSASRPVAGIEKIECRGCGRPIHPEAGHGEGTCARCLGKGARL